MPGISVTEAQKLLQLTDRIIKGSRRSTRCSESGRAETSTDPAPFSMLETLVILKPKSQWRKVDTWYSSWHRVAQARLATDLTRHPSSEDLVGLMNEALRLPGLSNAWTMPIKGRIDMLTTGIRTPVGLKISGANLVQIEQIGGQVEAALRQMKGTRSIFAERTGGGTFSISTGIVMNWPVTPLDRPGTGSRPERHRRGKHRRHRPGARTVCGERPLPARLPQQHGGDRSRSGAGRRGQKLISLSQLAEVSVAGGPAMIRDEDGLLTGYVYVDIAGQDPGGYIQEATVCSAES